MATATELLRAAEHMRAQAAGREYHRYRPLVDCAYVLEDEAYRLQAIEAQQSKRSWPEGWPPFAVLRRAFMSLKVSPTPSTMAVERRRRDNPTAKWAAAARRRAWDKAVRVGSLAGLASALEVAPAGSPQGPKNRPAPEAE